jgi:hypothetical protein
LAGKDFGRADSSGSGPLPASAKRKLDGAALLGVGPPGYRARGKVDQRLGHYKRWTVNSPAALGTQRPPRLDSGAVSQVIGHSRRQSWARTAATAHAVATDEIRAAGIFVARRVTQPLATLHAGARGWALSIFSFTTQEAKVQDGPSFTKNLEILGGDVLLFRRGQGRIEAVLFDLTPRRAPGAERLRLH